MDTLTVFLWGSFLFKQQVAYTFRKTCFHTVDREQNFATFEFLKPRALGQIHTCSEMWLEAWVALKTHAEVRRPVLWWPLSLSLSLSPKEPSSAVGGLLLLKHMWDVELWQDHKECHSAQRGSENSSSLPLLSSLLLPPSVALFPLPALHLT